MDMYDSDSEDEEVTPSGVTARLNAALPSNLSAASSYDLKEYMAPPPTVGCDTIVEEGEVSSENEDSFECPVAPIPMSESEAEEEVYHHYESEEEGECFEADSPSDEELPPVSEPNSVLKPEPSTDVCTSSSNSSASDSLPNSEQKPAKKEKLLCSDSEASDEEPEMPSSMDVELERTLLNLPSPSRKQLDTAAPKKSARVLAREKAAQRLASTGGSRNSGGFAVSTRGRVLGEGSNSRVKALLAHNDRQLNDPRNKAIYQSHRARLGKDKTSAPWTSLPDELILKIASYVQDTGPLAAVCKVFFTVLTQQNHLIWRERVSSEVKVLLERFQDRVCGKELPPRLAYVLWFNLREFWFLSGGGRGYLKNCCIPSN